MALRGLYILPSLFTAANLGAGFLSILLAINNEYTPAAWAIIVAMVMDILDGRVARLTNSTSAFGIEFDSLADLVSFGVAPAIMMYQIVLNTMSKLGVAIALFYVIAGALRLARFNVKANEGESSSHFSGLPIPAAAGFLASFTLSYQLFVDGPELTVKTLKLLMNRMPFFFKTIPISMVLISFLMVSSVPYLAVKKFKLNTPKSFQLFVLIIATVFLIILMPQNTIFILFFLYILIGLIGYLTRFMRLRQALRKLGLKNADTPQN